MDCDLEAEMNSFLPKLFLARLFYHNNIKKIGTPVKPQLSVRTLKMDLGVEVISVTLCSFSQGDHTNESPFSAFQYGLSVDWLVEDGG